MTIPCDDASLVQAALAGKRAAFSELAERYRNAVFGIAFHRLGDFELARDITQDALVTAYTELSTLREPAKFSHWLYQITRNKTAGIFRRTHPEVSLDYPDGHPRLTDVLSVDAVEQSERAWRVQEALSVLSDRDRLLVILHYACGYSHSEIGAMLEISISAIKSRIYRARHILREELLEMVEQHIQAELPNIELTEALIRISMEVVTKSIPGRDDKTFASVDIGMFGAKVLFTPASISAICKIMAEFTGPRTTCFSMFPIAKNSPERRMLTAFGFQDRFGHHFYQRILTKDPIVAPPIPSGFTIRRASTIPALELATGIATAVTKLFHQEEPSEEAIRLHRHLIEQDRVKGAPHETEGFGYDDPSLAVYDGDHFVAAIFAYKSHASDAESTPGVYLLGWWRDRSYEPALYADHLLGRILVELQQAGVQHVLVTISYPSDNAFIPIIEKLGFTVQETYADMAIELTPEMADTRVAPTPEIESFPEVPARKAGKTLRALPFTTLAGDAESDESITLTIKMVFGTSPVIAPGESYFIKGVYALHTAQPLGVELAASSTGSGFSGFRLFRRAWGVPDDRLMLHGIVQEDASDQTLYVRVMGVKDSPVTGLRIVLQK